MRNLLLPLLVISLITNYAIAQQTIKYTNPLSNYNNAVDLYENDQFHSAQNVFKEIQATDGISKKIKGSCSYYIVSCAIRINQSNAELLLEEYLDVYPESSNNNEMYLDAAFHFFDDTGYVRALKWFERVDDTKVAVEEQDRYNFSKGYSYFIAKKTDLAEEYLKQSVTTDKYGVQSKYYLGHMAYSKNEYKRAEEYLIEIESDKLYATKVNYLLADINFNLKKFEKAIVYGKKELEKSKNKERADLSKIIGESYFNLENYKTSIPYLEAYNSKYYKWTDTDYYQLGYAYYKEGNYDKAITQFNKIIKEKNGIAQNAYYHLGESYLKVDKKLEAFNAFKQASEMNFEPELQEDAYYNYAKLSYEIGNPYKSVPEVLQSFLDKYPKTTNKREVKKLIISSFVLSKDYKEALRLLEEETNISLPKVYQKSAFLLGKELFVDQKYKESLIYFQKALKAPVNPTFKAKTLFWKAEAEYLIGDYNESVISYKQFIDTNSAESTSEFKNVYYNLAYGYFKQKDYKSAIVYFEEYLKTDSGDRDRTNDSYLRLGDANYVTSAYWKAAQAYNKALEMDYSTADYAHFQKAMCYGYVDKSDKKIKNLEDFSTRFPESSYLDDVIFELANTYSLIDNNEQAVATYEKLVVEFPNSIFRSKALLRQALIHYNSDKDDQALVKLREVVSDFPSTPESKEAVATAKIIYIDQGKVDVYAKWIRSLDFIEVTDDELDNLTYESAEKQYLQNNRLPAIEAFADYIVKYPKGLHSLQANFYEAQLLYVEDRKDESIPYYEYVLDVVTNEYTQESLAKLSRIFLEKENYEKAIPLLERLENESSESSDKVFAISNLMKAYYKEKKYKLSVVYAEKVMGIEASDEVAKNDSQIIIARSAMQTGDEQKAKNTYAKLKGATGELGAEVLYYEAYFLNKEGAFEASNKQVQQLASEFSGYKYYGAKGLLIMADNFYGLKDNFQATYVLETVISNFQNYPDVVEEAQEQLGAIKEAEEFEFDEITE